MYVCACVRVHVQLDNFLTATSAIEIEETSVDAYAGHSSSRSGDSSRGYKPFLPYPLRPPPESDPSAIVLQRFVFRSPLLLWLRATCREIVGFFAENAFGYVCGTV